jgi:hypothetical protein
MITHAAVAVVRLTPHFFIEKVTSMLQHVLNPNDAAIEPERVSLLPTDPN